MADVGVLVAALTGLQALIGTAKNVNDIEFNRQVSEIQKHLIEVQKQMLELQEENRQLRDQLADRSALVQLAADLEMEQDGDLPPVN